MSAIRNLSPFDVMNTDEEEFLRGLIVQWHQRDAITIGELMRTAGGASQSTIYRRLMALRDKGLISLRLDKSDKRIKFVEPTALADKYARHISDALTGVTT